MGTETAQAPGLDLGPLGALLESVSDGFVALDRDWRYTYVNARAAEMFGRNAGSLLGKNYYDEYPEAAGTPFERAYRKVMTERVPVEIEAEYGPWKRWFENRIYPTADGIAIFFHEVTGRRRAEAALRESTLRLQMAARAGNVGLWDWDLRTNRVFFSPAWKRQLGYEDHEIRDDFSEWQSRVHPDDVARSLETVQAFIAAPWPDYQLEFRMRHKNGSYRWILSRGSLIAGEDGKPARMLGSHVDITERKKMEQALRESEEKLRLFVRHAPSAIAMFDREMRYLAFSRRWLESYGLDEEDLTGRCHYDVFPDLPERWKAVHQRCLAGAAEAADEDPFPRADGSVDWVRWETIPWRTGAGDIGGIIIFSEVITARKRAEAERAAAAERFEKIFRGAPEAMSITELASGRFVQVNDSFCRMFGYGREEIVGRTSLELDLWSDRGKRDAVVAKVVAGERISGFEGRARMRSGRLFDVLFSADGIDFGGVDCLLLMFVDVTARKRAEEELRAANERLHALSARLLEVQEQERAAIARELHDQLGQSLTALKLGLAAAGRALEGAPADKLGECTRIADQALSQVRSLALDLRPPQLDQLGLAATLRDYLERLAASAGVQTRFMDGARDLEPDKPLATAVFRVAQEALTNVARHAKAKTVVIELRARNGELVLAVADDGRGYDHAAARARAVKGHSMGLLGMEERVALAGGTLRTITRPGQGTRVEASFPLRARNRAPEAR